MIFQFVTKAGIVFLSRDQPQIGPDGPIPPAGSLNLGPLTNHRIAAIVVSPVPGSVTVLAVESAIVVPLSSQSGEAAIPAVIPKPVVNRCCG